MKVSHNTALWAADLGSSCPSRSRSSMLRPCHPAAQRRVCPVKDVKCFGPPDWECCTSLSPTPLAMWSHRNSRGGWKRKFSVRWQQWGKHVAGPLPLQMRDYLRNWGKSCAVEFRWHKMRLTGRQRPDCGGPCNYVEDFDLNPGPDGHLCSSKLGHPADLILHFATIFLGTYWPGEQVLSTQSNYLWAKIIVFPNSLPFLYIDVNWNPEKKCVCLHRYLYTHTHTHTRLSRAGLKWWDPSSSHTPHTLHLYPHPKDIFLSASASILTFVFPASC